MTSVQEDTLTMYYAVKSVNERFQTTWVSNAVYAASHNLWLTKLVSIEQNRDAQTLETAGITEDKKNKRTLMADKAMFIQNRLQSYGNVTNNTELVASVNYSPTKIRTTRDTDVVGICNIILSRASANATAIVAYGVTAAMITELQAAITAYSAVMSKPVSAKSQTKNATQNLAKLFREADNILKKRMDLDIELFKVLKPDFYSQYLTSRIIISTGGTALAIIGSAVAANTGEPIKGVTFSFTAENNGMLKSASVATVEKVVKKSAEKGSFRIPSLPEGTYNVKVKKLGYKEQQVTINVVKGETTTLKIEMEKN
jgi:hypothetical protein